MSQLKQIQEITKQWLEKENSPFSYVYDTFDLNSVGLEGRFDLKELTTLAFEAGKAECRNTFHPLKETPEYKITEAYTNGAKDTLAMVLKEIERSYHGYGSGDGYLIDRGFNIALDTLKTKLSTLTNNKDE